jgi:hypothetical protein
MTKSRWFQVLASLAILASFVCGQAMAEDQEHFQLRIHRQKIQKHARGRRSEFGTRPLQISSCPPAFPTCANIPTADLYTVFAGLGIMPQQDASQFGSTGYVYDEWPCDPANYGGGSPSVGCPYATIQGESENDGSGVFSGGIVIGYPVTRSSCRRHKFSQRRSAMLLQFGPDADEWTTAILHPDRELLGR